MIILARTVRQSCGDWDHPHFFTFLNPTTRDRVDPSTMNDNPMLSFEPGLGPFDAFPKTEILGEMVYHHVLNLATDAGTVNYDHLAVDVMTQCTNIGQRTRRSVGNIVVAKRDVLEAISFNPMLKLVERDTNVILIGCHIILGAGLEDTAVALKERENVYDVYQHPFARHYWVKMKLENV